MSDLAKAGWPSTEITFTPAAWDESWTAEWVPGQLPYEAAPVEGLTQSAFLWHNFTVEVVFRVWQGISAACCRLADFEANVDQALTAALELIFLRQPVARRDLYLQRLTANGFAAT